jgi:antitoxin component YwqK of YwqJK toxin-antitoxin module
MWFENGQKQSEANFADGKPHGLTTNWDENGQRLNEENWVDGELVDTE